MLIRMRLLLLIVMVCLVLPSQAKETTKVGVIEILGQERLDSTSVSGYLPIQVGDNYSDEVSNRIIKNLFASGFFSDVKVRFQDGKLTIQVQERPIIDQLEFVGVNEFDNDGLKKLFKENGVGIAQIFDQSVLDRATQALKMQYLGKGRYATEVITTTTPLARGRVSILIAVNEGPIAKIQSIKLLGNRHFSDQKLLDLMTLRTPGFWTWYTKEDRYSKPTLQADLQAIRTFYLSEGFLEFNVQSTQLSLTPDKQEMYLTLQIDEGKQYKVSSIKLVGQGAVVGTVAGGWNKLKEELESVVTLQKGQVFDGTKLTDSLKAIQDKLAEKGFAFSAVNAFPEINREKEELDFSILIDLGRRVYVRRIEIAGNTKTKDEVIRREMRLFEGGIFDGKKLTDSKDRITKLDFFENVNVETRRVENAEDQLDVIVSVQEKTTSSFNMTFSYSSAEKFSGSIGVETTNVFGSGQDMGVSLQKGRYDRSFVIYVRDPYFTDSGISQQVNFYDKSSKDTLTNKSSAAVRTTDTGISLKYGLPMSDLTRLFVGATVEKTKLELENPDASTASTRYSNFVSKYGNKYQNVLATLGWAKDSLDSNLNPTSGQYFYIGAEHSISGDLRYTKLTSNYQLFIPLTEKQTLGFNLDLAYGKGNSGKEYPFFKNFYVGGQGSVRGFESGSLGPRDTANDISLGGNKKINTNVEWIFPIPGMGKDKSLKFLLFVDGGMVWAENQSVKLSDMRYSRGFGLSWVTILGPLKFSWGYPINKKPTDKVARFEFKIGTNF
jgi:outer membrane protein insertion porin family